MNDITTALAKAGVKLPPQNQRIWTYLKDFGPGDVKKIASATKISAPTVQATITDMQKRKMLEKIPRRDHKGFRLTNHYRALGHAFELLPLPKKGGSNQEPAAQAAPATTREYATVTLNLPRATVVVYEQHAKEYGVTLQDVLRLAMETYAKKMGLGLPMLDPMAALRRKLSGEG